MRTWRDFSSTPRPKSSTPALLETTVRFLEPWGVCKGMNKEGTRHDRLWWRGRTTRCTLRSMASMRYSGMPHRPKPPTNLCASHGCHVSITATCTHTQRARQSALATPPSITCEQRTYSVELSAMSATASSADAKTLLMRCAMPREKSAGATRKRDSISGWDPETYGVIVGVRPKRSSTAISPLRKM